MLQGTGEVRPSFLSNALASLDGKGVSGAERERELDTIQDVAATIFGTAGDTTTDAILTLIFALATRPEIRRRIQDELDSVLMEHDEHLGEYRRMSSLSMKFERSEIVCRKAHPKTPEVRRTG